MNFFLEIYVIKLIIPYLEIINFLVTWKQTLVSFFVLNNFGQNNFRSTNILKCKYITMRKIIDFQQQNINKINNFFETIISTRQKDVQFNHILHPFLFYEPNDHVLH